MVDIKQLQEKVYQNKVEHGFNVTDVYQEFCYLNCEISEAFEAWHRNGGEGLGEELADVAIYLLGLCEILGVDLETEILRKMEKNSKRKYMKVDGKWVHTEGN